MDHGFLGLAGYVGIILNHIIQLLPVSGTLKTAHRLLLFTRFAGISINQRKYYRQWFSFSDLDAYRNNRKFYTFIEQVAN